MSGQTLNRTRNSNIEVLRFVLMVSIFLWHLLVHGCDFKDIGHIDYKYNIYLSIVAAALFEPCVNCFMFISGWFGMKLKVQKIMKLSVICILSGVVSLIILIMFGKEDCIHIGLTKVYSILFPISTNVWWFVTSYMMVYLVSPFIEKGMEYLENKVLIIIIIAMTMIEVLCIPRCSNWGSSFFGLLYIYIIGRYMRIHKIRLVKKQAILLFLSMTLIMIFCLLVFNALPIKKGILFSFLQYNNPIIILQGIALFFVFWNLHPNYSHVVNWLFKPCLCIYLITEMISPYHFVVVLLEKNPFEGVLMTVGIIIACLGLGQIVFFVADKVVPILYCKLSQLKIIKTIK